MTCPYAVHTEAGSPQKGRIFGASGDALYIEGFFWDFRPHLASGRPKGGFLRLFTLCKRTT